MTTLLRDLWRKRRSTSVPVRFARCRVTLILLLGLAGCTYGHEAENTGFVFQPERGNGVIVGSVSETTAGARPDNVYFGFARSDGANRGLLATNESRLAADILVGFMFNRNDFESESGTRGRVFAVELPPGDYFLLGWQIVSGDITIVPISAPRIRFAVRPGEISYIGNLHMALSDSNRGIWSEVMSGEARIENRLERDLAILSARYATLRAHTIAPRVVDGSPWRGLPINRTVRRSPGIVIL